MSIDGDVIELQANENGHRRGMHLVIINPQNGKVETAQVFDTYKTSEDFASFVTEPIPKGRIVAAACEDDCTSSLSPELIKWFSDMGSKEISQLEYRQSFAFIGVIGKSGPVNESRGTELSQKVSVS